jgi:hypothetical protein
METDAEAGTVPAARPPYGDPLLPEPIQFAPDPQPVAVLEELLVARGERLLRAAVMLAGSHADGEDLLQAALERVNAITIATKDGTEKLWINATTYLPIQLVIVDSKDLPPAGYNNAPSPGQVQQFTFLPPTPTNLSYLASPILAGFTRS